MRRVQKIAIIVLSSLAGLIAVLTVAGIVIVQTQWFRNLVREKIITATEDATGGTVEVGSFSFDWHHLRAEVRNFVIRGTEPANAAPLLRANFIEITLKLTSPFKQMVDIHSLVVDTPQANVIVYPDGRTNIPAPKIKSKDDRTALETIVDLAIRHFDLRNGTVMFADRKIPIDGTGENLRAQLSYNIVPRSYQGQISIQPLHTRYGTNQPVDINVVLPIVLEKDKVQLTDARITTPESTIVISGAMDHLVAPHTSAHVNARIALDEVQRAAGRALPLHTSRDLPRVLDADVVFTEADNLVQVSTARMTLGQSNLEASGTLKDLSRKAVSGGRGTLQFNAKLALGELGRMLQVASRPQGMLRVGGNARMNSSTDYLVTANVDARGLAFQQGGHRLSGVNLDTSLRADPTRIDLNGIRLAALGGSFTGNASLVNRAAFRVNGKLNHFDLREMARPFLSRPLPYDGVISGPIDAAGNINEPAQTVATARLVIQPGRRGVPVSGRLNTDYNGRADTVTIARSYVALPSSRLDLSGTLGRSVQLRLVSHDLNDFAPAMSMTSQNPSRSMPVALHGGAATFTGAVTGKLASPRITGHLEPTNFLVEDRPFSLLAADLYASSTGAAIRNGTLARGPMQAQFAASVGLRNWNPESWEPLSATASIRNADLSDMLALAGRNDTRASGSVTASAQISGTVGDPRGNVAFDVVNGTLYDEHFDQLTARAVLTNRSIDLSTLHLAAGTARLDANGSYQHPQGDIRRGVIRAHVASNQMSLDQFRLPQAKRANLSGLITMRADATANVQPFKGTEDIQLVALNGDFNARGLQQKGKSLGDLTATVQTVGSNLDYRVNSNFAGSSIRVNGQTLLAGDHVTTANAVISGLPIQQVLAVAGREDIHAAGLLSTNANLAGTLADPHAKANLTITKGMFDDEPFDRLQADFTYSNQLLDLPSFLLTAGPNRIDARGSFTHPPRDFSNGQVQFHLASNRIQLATIRTLERVKPGLAGALQLAADGAATLRNGATPLVQNLNANVSASGLAVNGKPVGDATATAVTRGTNLTFNVTSDFARANIRGGGQMQLQGNYPLNAQLTFTNLTYRGLENWLGPTARPGFDALVEGRANITGPALAPQDLKGLLELSKLEVNSTPQTQAAQARTVQNRRVVQLHNSGPVLLTLDRSLVRIQSAHIEGPQANLTLSGTASIQQPRTLNLRADGNVRLELMEAFDPDVFSSGTVLLNAAIQGTPENPLIDGRLQLQNASFNMIDAPNGISNANGVIVFNGREATIQNVTGESGGGKITLAGYVTYGGPEMRFRLQATGDRVLVQYPTGVGTMASARINLTGTTSRSLLSGNVTIVSVALHSHTDIGSMLSQTAAPATTPEAKKGLLAGMRMDLRIDTAPDVQFRTALAQNLEAEAHMRLRGTPSRPGILGRIDVNQGQVIFFGTKYNIDQGSVAFYNPQKVEPVLNVDLSTSVKGVDVNLSVTGSMDRLKLTYRSDPPLQFSDIVALLATGKLPTTDPVLAASQPVPPQQSLEQKGASALLGQAVVNPVAGRLQRVFGVSKLKIDPQIIGAQNTPQARLTLEQQITRDLTFTYIQDVTSSNSQIVRVQWDIDPRWSAIAERQLNGEFGVDLFYKRSFR